MKRGDVLAWFEAHPGEHTAEDVVTAFGLVWAECKPFRNKIASLAHTGNLTATGPRPKRYSFAKPITPADEHIRRAVAASVAKRAIPAEERAARHREWRREWMDRPGVRERVRENQRLARIRNGRNKGVRVVMTPEERAARERLRNQARAAARKAARAAKPKPPKPEKIPRIPKPKPVKPEQVKVKPSRRVKDDGAFTPAAMIRPPAERLPSSDDFLRAGGVIERLPSFLDRRAA